MKKFSKFLSGVARLYPDDVTVCPHWFAPDGELLEAEPCDVRKVPLATTEAELRRNNLKTLARPTASSGSESMTRVEAFSSPSAASPSGVGGGSNSRKAMRVMPMPLVEVDADLASTANPTTAAAAAAAAGMTTLSGLAAVPEEMPKVGRGAALALDTEASVFMSDAVARREFVDPRSPKAGKPLEAAVDDSAGTAPTTRNRHAAYEISGTASGPSGGRPISPAQSPGLQTPSAAHKPTPSLIATPDHVAIPVTGSLKASKKMAARNAVKRVCLSSVNVLETCLPGGNARAQVTLRFVSFTTKLRDVCLRSETSTIRQQANR